MVRLADVQEDLRRALIATEMPSYAGAPWVAPPPLPQARVAIVSTAGLHRAADKPFSGHTAEYRIIPGDVDYADIVMTHLSVNFDRSGVQNGVSVAFPLQRLDTLAANGEIGSVAQWHYSFMGATHPDLLTDTAREVARLLKDDGVTAAVLIPI